MNIQREFKCIKWEQKQSFGILTINRPDKLNALNTEVLSEIKEVLRELKQDKDFSIKGLILTGEGDKAFVAGADIAAMSGMGPDEGRELGELGQNVTLLLEKLPIPVIAAVGGFALGGGCELAMAADFIIATKNAVFGQPEVKLGLIPGFGGTQRLSRLVGRNRAKELIYTGRTVDAEEAHRIGLVLSLHTSKAEMMEKAFAMLEQMAKNSPRAISISKRVMNDGNDLTIVDGLDLELNRFSEIFSSEDMREGTRAFVEKRKPNFSGR